MKKLFAGLVMAVILSSANVSFAADPEGYQAISKEQVSNYAHAAFIAVRANWGVINPNGKCNYEFASNVLTNATGAMIRSDSGQPLLIVNNQMDENTVHRVMLTTSADYKTVTAIRFQTLVMGEVNSGDLRKPVISKDFAVAEDLDCSK